MTKIYVPIGQKNKNVQEHHKTYVSKLIGDGWVHEGVVKLKDMFGAEIEFVVLVGDGLCDGCEDIKEM